MFIHVDREKIWQRLHMKEPIKPSINESILILEELTEVEKQRDKLAHALDEREDAIKLLNRLVSEAEAERDRYKAMCQKGSKRVH